MNIPERRSNYELQKPLLIPEEDERFPAAVKQLKDFGIEDSETWCLATSLVSFLAPRLRRFQEIHKDFKADKELNEKIDKLVKAFDIMYEDEKGVWMFSDNEQETIDEGLKLLPEIFFGLWW